MKYSIQKEVNEAIIEQEIADEQYWIDHPITQEDIEIDNFIYDWNNMGKVTPESMMTIIEQYAAMK